MSLVIFLSFVLITFLDIPDMLHHKEWRMLTVYAILWTTGLAILLLFSFGVELPSPLKMFDSIFRMVFSPLYMKQ